MQCSYLNPLSANPTKWSNTLKQFVTQTSLLRLCLRIILEKKCFAKNLKDYSKTLTPLIDNAISSNSMSEAHEE